MPNEFTTCVPLKVSLLSTFLVMICHDVLMMVTRQGAFEELQMAYFYILGT